MATKKQYIGRFAPSPTGKLHLGSLIAALASYCDAMKNKGKWLLRIEDIDPPREVSGASKNIIQTLMAYGFYIEQPIVFQSHPLRQNNYQKAIEKLQSLSALYACPCSRQDLKNLSIHQHLCRTEKNKDFSSHSLKLKVPNKNISFNDKIQGKQVVNLLSDCGDCVLKRKDGLFAYQLAVVVDDAAQGITHIVRGIDILESTPWQIYLNSLLNNPMIEYAHIPILVNSKGQKLSKQTFAKEIDRENPLDVLLLAHALLQQKPFPQKPKSIQAFWLHAIKHWNINKVSKNPSIQV